MSKRKRINRKVLRDLRKAKADLAALISYEKECSSLLIEYTLEWNEDFTSFLKTIDKSYEDKDSEAKDLDNKLQKEFFEKAEEPQGKNEVEEIDHSLAPDWVKKAFRKLALKTHPDRVSDNLDSERLVDIYSRANAAIEEKNYDLFTQICAEMNVACDLDPEVELEICLEHQKNISSSLASISKSLPWLWGESYGNDPIRKNIIFSVLPHYGISEIEDSKIKNFLEKLHSS